jgi:nucleotide-binding universal stress UspA family protein
MSEKSTKFDEFASLFRSVVRPHLEVEPLPLNNLLVIVDVHSDDEKYNGICNVAESMLDQFKPKVKLFAPVALEEDLAIAEERLKILSDRLLQGKDVQLETEARRCLLAKSILEEADSFQADFLVMPSLVGERDRSLEGFTLGAVVDMVLSNSARPILLIEGDVPEAEQLWTDILLFIEEVDTAEPCLAATRTLAGKAAEARMLHVIDSHMLGIVERAFKVATELETTKASEALTAALQKDMDHFLEAAKDLLDRTGHTATYHIQVGDPVDTTRKFIQEHGPHLVVCNSVAPDERLVDSVAYNLAAYLREVPLLLV